MWPTGFDGAQRTRGEIRISISRSTSMSTSATRHGCAGDTRRSTRNHVRSIVDTYAAHLYRDDIPREVTGAADDILREFWADVDLLGNPADEFWEEVAQLVQVQGRGAVVCDRWETAEASTRAQEREIGVRPYAYWVGAEDVVDWSVDRRGRLGWVVIREARELDRSPMSSGGEAECQYRVWYADRWELFVEVESEDSDSDEASLRKIEEGTHPVGEVPVTLVFWGKRHGREASRRLLAQRSGASE